MKRRVLAAILIAVAFDAAVALATPAKGVTSVTLAKGTTTEGVSAVLTVGSRWGASLHTDRPADVYYNDLTLQAGGYTGWHSHSGILLVTVAEGSVIAVEQNCKAHLYTAGQTFAEGMGTHDVLNPSPGNARLVFVGIYKKGETVRRIDEAQPACAVPLDLP